MQERDSRTISEKAARSLKSFMVSVQFEGSDGGFQITAKNRSLQMAGGLNADGLKNVRDALSAAIECMDLLIVGRVPTLPEL